MLPNKLCRVRRFGLLLAISQTQDIRDDTVGIIIFDHKVWHRTVRGVQCGSECSGCHSWEVRYPGERWRLLICRAAILFYDQVTLGASLSRNRRSLRHTTNLSGLCSGAYYHCGDDDKCWNVTELHFASCAYAPIGHVRLQGYVPRNCLFH